MRPLTKQQQIDLNQRRSEFPRFVAESFDVLVGFLSHLNLEDPASVAEDAAKFVPAVDDWMKSQVVSSDDRIWILVRIGYLIGEVLSQRYDGRWLLEENPESPYFLEYVIGEFRNLPILNTRLSPFAIANNYVDEPEGRSLTRAIARAEDGLRKIVCGR